MLSLVIEIKIEMKIKINFSMIYYYFQYGFYERNIGRIGGTLSIFYIISGSLAV